MSRRRKTEIQDFDRGIYDLKNEVKHRDRLENGINEDVIRKISAKKNEPQWMLDFRLKALKLFNELENPTWGSGISEVDTNKVTTYISPDAGLSVDWDDVPEDIRNTFDSLGIPEVEKDQFLSGVGAQYDSEVVYHSVQKYLKDQEVIYTDFDTAIREHEDSVKEYFDRVTSPNLHKYATLHYAVWSGGFFVYAPKEVNVSVFLQPYYRLSVPGAGQPKHVMIIVEDNAYCHFIEGCSALEYNVLNIHAGSVEIFVGKRATCRFSTIENWSRNIYNLNTRRSIIQEGGKVEWVSGSFGSRVSYLYLASVLVGPRAAAEITQISFAGAGQNLDTGAIMIHAAPDTKPYVNSKSISKGDGTCCYRSSTEIKENAHGSKAFFSRGPLMSDNQSKADATPVIKIENGGVDFGHEATIGWTDDSVIYYPMTRGISEEEAKPMVVRDFAELVAKELPMECIVETNSLISLELKGSIG